MFSPLKKNTKRNKTLQSVFLRSGFVIVLVLSFFAFVPQLRWLMQSPLILQFQMLGYEKIQPGVYVGIGAVWLWCGLEAVDLCV